MRAQSYRRRPGQNAPGRMQIETLESRHALAGSSLIPLAGDWSSIGTSGVGLYDSSSGKFFLRDSTTPGFADNAVAFGGASPTTSPLSGDWDGNGTNTIGTYDSATSTFNLRNSNSAGAADINFRFGPNETVVPQNNLPPFEQIIDDGGAGYSQSGSWSITNDATGYLHNARYAAAGNGSTAANWTFSGLAPAQYKVLVRWVPFSNRATNAPYTIFDGSASEGTTPVNQQLAPNDEAAAGVSWKNLGTYDISSGTLRVNLTNSANGFVIADAVRIVRITSATQTTVTEQIIDDGAAGYTQAGAWNLTNDANSYQHGARYAAAGSGSIEANWTFSGLDTGQYQVFVSWVPFSNRATNAPYTILDSATVKGTVAVNQKLDATDEFVGGIGFKNLGAFNISSGTLKVKLTNNANGFVIADAVRIVRVTAPAPAMIIDDGGVGYTQTGTWNITNDATGYLHNARYAAAGDGSTTANWTFSGLSNAMYQVYARWVPFSNRATNAPYTIFDGVAQEGSASINQQLEPDDSFSGGYGWESLGVIDVSSGTLKVKLSNLANGFVIADSVRIVNISPPPVIPGATDFGSSNPANFQVIVGDWDGDGHDGVGLYDPATGKYFLKDDLTAGQADYEFVLGPANAGLTAIAGDWDGDGDDTVGFYNQTNGQFSIQNQLNVAAVDQVFNFGATGVGGQPVVGDWDGDGDDTVGVFNPASSVFSIRNSLTTGPSDEDFYVVPSLDPVANGVVSALAIPPQLNAMEVQTLLDRASAASNSNDAIIAVVDRGGHILGVRVEAGVPISDPATLVFAIDGAVAKARTAAFFSNGDPTNGPNGTAGPLTSRTVRFISQSTVTQREVESNPNDPNPNSTTRGPGFVAPIGIGGHFPPGVTDAPSVDLFAIEHSNRDSLTHPGADGVKGTVDDIALPSRFNVPLAFIPPGQEIDAPESYGTQSGSMPNAQARGIATLPGGIPLFRGGTLIGGIGVFFPGTNGYATFEQNFIPGSNQTEADRTNSFKTRESEWIALAAANGSSGLNAVVGNIAGIAPVPGIDLPAGRIDLAGITLESIGPQAGMGGLQDILGLGASVRLNGTVSGVLKPVDPANDLTIDGQEVPDGWLVLPHGSALISAAEVMQVVTQGIAEANLDRAQIRLQVYPDGSNGPGARTRMVFALADLDGNVLALYRMQDATFFSIDVAVAKARNEAYYADSSTLQTADRVDDNHDGIPDPSVPAGAALSSRTFRFLAEPRYPSGIDGTQPGAFSILNDPGFKTSLLASRDPNVNTHAAENSGAPVPASAFNSVLGFDSFHPGSNFRDPNNIANQNGVVFFPGSTPLYKTNTLVAGFGVSGDGVDQDDIVTFYGAVGFDAPASLKADQFFVRGVRLPFQKFPRNPRA